MILGMFYKSDDTQHQAARRTLLAPIVEQNEAVRAYLRARRQVRDVDPDTGDLDDAPVDAPVDSPAEPLAALPAGASKPETSSTPSA